MVADSASQAHQTNNVSNHSSAEGSGSVSMAQEIPLFSKLPMKPTKDCSGSEIQRTPRTSVSPPRHHQRPLVSALDDITSYLRQKLLNGILLLDNY